LVELLIPSDEITGAQGQTERNIAEKYVQMSSSFPELIRNLKKGEKTEKDRNIAQAIMLVRMRAETLFSDFIGNP
jgi:hypothetical protein